MMMLRRVSFSFSSIRNNNTLSLASFTLPTTNVILLHRFCSAHPHSSLSNPPGPLTQYRSLVELGKLQHDPHQEKVALELENLLGRLQQYEREMEEYHVKLTMWEEKRENERRRLLMEEADSKEKSGVWSSVNKRRDQIIDRLIFWRKADYIEPGVGRWVSYLNRERKLDTFIGRRPTAPPAPKGLYLYGNVGSGKTMLMDMFYTSTEGIVKHRKRFHFHEAMLEINERMHKVWKSQREKSTENGISSWIMNLPLDLKVKEWIAAEENYKQERQVRNILPTVADKFLVDRQACEKGASILCFDEIQTVDVFAIVALSGILSRLLSTGTILVATSNRAPMELNQDGMQKDLFLKFLVKLEEHCESVLIGSEVDYRRLIGQRSVQKAHYFWPLDSNAVNAFDKVWNEIIRQSGESVCTNTIPVMFGRSLEVPQSCNGVARFTFEYLCGRTVGAADYIALAKNYHTVFISDIPSMSMRIRDKARRFITLIDELYNHHCSLFCSAAASIDDLFQGTEEGTLFDLESFQFETETEGGKLRRDVLAGGNVSSGGAPSGIISLLSGQEEMFAFQRAGSRLIEMQSPLYLEGVRYLHPYFHKGHYKHGDDGIYNLQTQQHF